MLNRLCYLCYLATDTWTNLVLSEQFQTLVHLVVTAPQYRMLLTSATQSESGKKMAPEWSNYKLKLKAKRNEKRKEKKKDTSVA